MGQCLALPKIGAAPVLPSPSSNNVPPGSQKDQTAKSVGDPYVYFPTSDKPLADLSRYIGGGAEGTFGNRVIMKGSIAGFQGHLVEWEVSFAGVVRVGRRGTVGTIWQTTDQVTKYRADLIAFGEKQVATWYGGIDFGIRKVEAIGNGQHRMQVGLTLGSQLGDVSLEGKITADSQGGYTFTASRKVDSQTTVLPDGTEMTVRGDFQISIRLGPNMQWVLATYSAWSLTKNYMLGWIQGGARDFAKIDWERTAVTGAGVVSVAAAGIRIYKWARFVLETKAIGEVLGNLLMGTARTCSGLIIIILPQDYWERNLRQPGQPPPMI